MITEDAVISASKDIEAAELDGEAVLLDVKSGQYYGLSAVGARILAMLDKPMTVREIVNTLSDVYDVSADQLRRDTVAFLTDMQEKHLIQTLDGEVA